MKINTSLNIILFFFNDIFTLIFVFVNYLSNFNLILKIYFLFVTLILDFFQILN